MEYPITNYIVDEDLKSVIKDIQNVVNRLNARRENGLNLELKKKIFKQIKISHVYNSNAIEGNTLTLRETEVILDNLELNDKPLKDQIEAKTLSNAIDFLYDLINGNEKLNKRNMMELHQILLTGIPNIAPGVCRKKDVKIKNSDHSPPEWILVEEHLEKMYQWYDQTTSIFPIVKAAILHHWITWIHPFEDGNGRISRLIMNFYLLQNGYPEIIIRIEDRDRYYNALTAADKKDLSPLIELITDKLYETTSIYEEFLNEEEREKEWIGKFNQSVATKKIETHKYDYEVWRSSMDVFKTRFHQSISLISDKVDGIELQFRDFPIISFNQYLDIIENRQVSNTWYFTLALVNQKKYKKITVIFYFERFYPPIQVRKPFYEEGKKKVKVVKKKARFPFIKLYASVREAGHTKKLDDKIEFVNVGMKGDKMMVGVKDFNRKGYVESKETHLATPIIRKLIDQLLEVYMDFNQ
ncbi:Fic family protein [Flavobacterium fontis]|uniref:Fic family protein n=1 Tax=Flavobacterium fontis TaxID=1124188 RepID=A0A1M5AGT3_9FLAO|nr:Fic family protein [Flavobacterium fontis]SHF29336.1 Fic family protein [Flavobacterium fontis]